MAKPKQFEVLGYKKKSGSRIKTEDEQEVGEALATLASGSDVHPQDVVDAAEDPSSVLHKYFTWDDEAAARQHRLTQAGYIIRSMDMQVAYVRAVNNGEEEDNEPRVATIRMLQSTRNDGNDGYVYKSTLQVLGDPEKTEEVYFNMYTYLMGAFRRFSVFEEIAEDLNTLESIVVSLADKIGRTEAQTRSHIAKIKRGV